MQERKREKFLSKEKAMQERKRAEFEFHRRKQLRFPVEVRVKEREEGGEGALKFLRKLLKSQSVKVGPVGAGVQGNISVGSFSPL